MADYYSVISQAVAALEMNTFEDRRAIYNRARGQRVLGSEACFAVLGEIDLAACLSQLVECFGNLSLAI